MNIRRVFIANRGEIAARIIFTCRALGIETGLGASQADMDSAPARLADKVICIGPPRSGESYLNIEAVVASALRAKADAVHPKIVGDALLEISKDKVVSAALFNVLEVKRLLESEGKLTLIPKNNELLAALMADGAQKG